MWNPTHKNCVAYFHGLCPWHHKVTAGGRPMASEIWFTDDWKESALPARVMESTITL